MKRNYYNNLWMFLLLISMSALNVQAQSRTSSAYYPGIVEFSGSQSSANGLVYEIMPGPSVINPAMNPTPFSDNINISTGSYNLLVADVDANDSPDSKDSVANVNILFTGNNGMQYKIDKIMIIHKPEEVGAHSFFGGIALNKIMHGNTEIGTELMPKMMAYITLWGLTDLKDANADTVIASNRVIHLMVATNVRDSLKLDTNVVADRSDYNIKNAQTHVILPPLDMAGNMDPIPGTDHGFLHMMFEKPLLTNGNKDWTKVYEILPGPAVMNPAMNPTPFSDKIGIGEGSYALSVINIDSADSPNSRDSVISVNISYERPNGDKFMIDKIKIIHKPNGAGDHSFFGGVGYGKLMHGNTGIGTGLMPKMTAYVTLWGVTDLKDGNGNILASNRIIHLMVASRVRTNDLSMIASGVNDSSDYNPSRMETHIILPPLDKDGKTDPVPGTGHGFLHLMFENVSMQDSLLSSVQSQSASDIQVRAYPNPFGSRTTIEYRVEHQSRVQVILYDSKGSKIRTLVNESQTSGLKRVNLEANDLPSGLYFYTIVVDEFRKMGKLSLIR